MTPGVTTHHWLARSSSPPPQRRERELRTEPDRSGLQRSTVKSVPKKHQPTREERDERVTLPLPPDEAIEAILATGPHPDEDED